MQWIFLVSAGCLEICWAVTLKLTNGWTNYGFLAVNVCFGLAAAFCLSQAMRSIPLATAYPVWKGIAILGLVLWEVFIDKQPFNLSRTFFVLLILLGIVGLKLSSVVQPSTP